MFKNFAFFASLRELLFGREIKRRVDLAIRALDDLTDRAALRNTYPRDRYDYDRDEVLRDALDAWRTNPIARRIVALTSQYVVGGGIGVECKNERTHRFLQTFWTHRLNHMDQRVFEWCDELTRTGNLFVVISTDPAGMSFVRAIPTADIFDIESTPNDVEQELTIWERPRLDGTETAGPNGQLGHPWRVYQEGLDFGGAVMLHYTINRPIGARWGEPDLAPILRWLARYSVWLEDRARLNRYRQSFLYVVKSVFTSQAERLARQAEINANPPSPGSILVADNSEEWSVMAPQLASHEAAEDGLAIKKMIAAGSANPLHFLAEPESATRTTAEASGGPTYRHYEQRQEFFLWMIQDICKVIVARRGTVDRRISARAEITVKGTDIESKDNSQLATAATAIITAFSSLRDRKLIDDAELLRMAYRFAGEVVDVEDMLRRGGIAPTTEIDNPSPEGRSEGDTPPTPKPETEGVAK